MQVRSKEESVVPPRDGSNALTFCLIWGGTRIEGGIEAHRSTERRADFGQRQDGRGNGPDPISGDEGGGDHGRVDEGVGGGKVLPDAQDDGSDGHVEGEVTPARGVN